MAKKFEIDGLLEQFHSNIDTDKQKVASSSAKDKKAERVEEKKDKGHGTSWRAKQRTAAKTIHFDPLLSSKINQIKEWRKLAGEPNATAEDLIHEMCEEYIANHLEELKEKYKDYIL